jgi:hypothetical protein
MVHKMIIPLQRTSRKSGKTYYVDTAGDDGNSGLSPTAAWQSIAKVAGSAFLPGDRVLFKRGGTWTAKLTFPSSGKAGKPITIADYGSGDAPVITGRGG